MKILKGKEQDYKEWYDNNSDAYGHRCFTYAECWTELLENEIDKSEDTIKVIIEKAKETSHIADTDGITGFMYGMAINILS